MAKTKSRSRSRSRSPHERIDKFGRVIPPDKQLPHSRSRSIERYKRRSRSPRQSQSFRSRSRSHSRSSSLRAKMIEQDMKNRTNIEDPAFLNARIFIGNLPSDRTTKEDLENLFQVYGKILGVSIHDRGFGFVQFEQENDAKRAQEAENGSKLKGQVLDVKMAAEGRRGPGGRGGDRGAARGRGGDFDRDNHDRGMGRGHGDYERDRGGYPSRDGRAPPPMHGRERSPMRGEPYEDRYRDRDPYPRREPPLPRDSLDRPGMPPHPSANRDDPYRRQPLDDPYRDPYRDDPFRRDPYRRDPYDDPYREIYRDPYREPFLPPLPPKKPMPADVQIICMNKQLTLYGESIDSRLRQHAMICEMVVIPDDMTVPKMLEEAARLKFLFAIIINSQNEVLKSLTLNILHGTPQEHRNMPLEDAMKLVATSFEKYIQTQREKTAVSLVAPVVGPAVAAPLPPFLPPSSDISYLLNLLADNRQLTIEELEKVIEYLSERKNKIMVAEGRRPQAAETALRQVPSGVPVPSVSTGDTTSMYLQQQQQELQNKILNILNGTSLSSSGSTQTPAAQSVQAQVQAQGGYSSIAGVPRTQASQAASNPMINFDNPNVKKALDNLIQSGPNLLKNLPTTVTQSSSLRQGQFQSAAQQGTNQPRQAAYTQQQQPQGAQQNVQAGFTGVQYSQFQQLSQVQGQPALRGAYGASQQQQQRPMVGGARAPQQGTRPRY